MIAVMQTKDRIIFYGTPEFATASLKELFNEGFNIIAVVTAPDKAAGRGQKLIAPAVKQYAQRNGLPIYQPQNLRGPDFTEQICQLKPDLQVVVAFRMLPRPIWELPKKGTINLHASLLPAYRGAAPIHHAIINGETTTGITTFFINEKIDNGEIIFREKTPIYPEDDAGMLHDRMMQQGARMVAKTCRAIQNNDYSTQKQKELYNGIDEFKKAPKIFREDCLINWRNKNMEQLRNFIRGLSPYPGAYTYLKSPEGKTHQLKIFEVATIREKHDLPAVRLITDGKKYLDITTHEGYIQLQEVQISGKKKMNIREFLRGFPINKNWIIESNTP